MPVSTGRVSSREAHRATLLIVATNAAPGTCTRPSPSGSGNGGKSSSRSVRMWNVAAPATISTSCSAVTQLERHGVAGQRADDVDEQPGRQHDGRPRGRPRRRAGRAGRSPCRWRAARCRRRPPISCTPERAWTALRVDGRAGDGLELGEQRLALGGKSHLVRLLHDSIRTTTLVEVTVIRAVDGVHNRGRARTMRGMRVRGVCTGARESASRRGVMSARRRCPGAR